jgi:hypothetical protein
LEKRIARKPAREGFEPVNSTDRISCHKSAVDRRNIAAQQSAAVGRKVHRCKDDLGKIHGHDPI